MRILLLLLIICFNVEAQVTIESINARIDSVIQLRYKDAKKAIELAERNYKDAKLLSHDALIGKTGNHYSILLHRQNEYEKAKKIIKESLKFADEKIRIASVSVLAMIYTNLGQVDSAFVIYSQAVQDIKSSGDSLKMIAPVGNLALLLKESGNYSQAMQKLLSIKELVALSEDQNEILSYQGMLATLLISSKDYNEAIKKLNENLDYINTLNDPDLKQIIAGHKARTFTNLGLAYNKLKDYEKALSYYEKAMKIKKTLDDRKGLGITIFNIAETHQFSGDLTKAEMYAIECYNIFNEIKHSKGMMLSNALLGNIYNDRNVFTQAEEKYKIASDIAVKLNSADYLSQIYESRAELYEKQNKFKDALFYHKKFKLLNDSIFNETKQRGYNLLKVDWETYRKDVEIERQQKQIELQAKEISNGRTLNFTLFFLSLALGSAFYFYKERNKQIVNNEEILDNNKAYLEDSNPALLAFADGSQSEPDTLPDLRPKQQQPKSITLTNRAKDKLSFKDIIHISTEKGIGVSNYYCINGKKYEDYHTLKNLNSILSKFGFIQVHRSHIINIEHISSKKSTQVKLSNGKVIPVGRTFKKNL